ncbi:MAG: HAD family phosphatase [Bacteroidota bacterium]
MIKAVIFDLDGTLIQTEVLKATSYARAIRDLTKNEILEELVLTVFEDFVGLSRADVVKGLSSHFEMVLKKHLKVSDAFSLQKVLIEKRLEIYREILNDTDLLSQHFCLYTLGLLRKLQEDNFKLVLATMSHLPEAKKITTMMGIFNNFDLMLTREDVSEGKPHPEIYVKARNILGVKSEECLVLEDSVNGIKAGQHAGMPVFAVTNKVTRASVHHCNLLEDRFIVDDLPNLVATVYDFINQQKVMI